MFFSWLTLAAAIAIEVGASALLPKAQGFRDPLWTAVVLVGYGLAIWLLTLVVRHMPVSTAYAVWAGLGTAGIAVIGAVFLGERLDLVGILAVAAIIGGVVVLNLTGAH